MTVAVVGGGAAGMMAAIAAAENGHTVKLIEQNEKLGKKLFLTGKGRCNLTNACPVEELFDNIVTNPKFMYSCLYDLDNTATVELFKEYGLAVKTERGNRVFPVSDHSSDVIKVLKNRLDSLGVDIMLNTRFSELLIDDGGIKECVAGVILKRGKETEVIYADAVILATGGMSYRSTGSDGAVLKYLPGLGISVKEPQPSLVPFACNDRMITDMQGLSLKNVGLTVMRKETVLYSGFGEMLFTHFGLSGPLVLSASAYTKEEDYKAGIKAYIDLKPALSHEELDARVLRDFERFQNRDFANSLGKLLPSKMITAVIKRCGIAPGKKVNVITRQERQRLVEVLKNFEIKISGNRGFDEAIITRGGVNVSQIDPSTLECKKIKGLYFAGEMIDVDALTGGFNLQIAWSTGHLSGKCKRSVKKGGQEWQRV